MIEKYLPTKLNYDDSERDMPPGQYRDAKNLVVFSGNKGGLRKANTMGTKLVSVFPGLVGGAKCIGATYQDSTRKAIFFFWQNNSGDQCVIFEADASLSPTNPIITKLVSSYNMGITSSSYLNNGRFAGDLLYFNFKGLSQKVINITRAKSVIGFYDTLSEEALSVIKAPTLYALTAIRATSGSPPTDPSIIHKAFQFAVRLNFIDSEQGVLSDASDYLPAIAATQLAAGNDIIQVAIVIQPGIFPVIDTVELFVRNTNNPSDWRSVKLIPSSSFNLSGTFYGFTYIFDDTVAGTLLAADDALKLYDSEPKSSNSLELINNRLFVVDTLVDYNEEIGWDFVLANVAPGATRDDRAGYTGLVTYTQVDFQWDSEYIYCAYFKDKFGRRIPSSSKNKVFRTPSYPFINTPGGDGLSDSPQDHAQGTITFSGKPPSYAQALVIARSKNIKWDWQIMQKSLVRFLYSTVPWDGVSALPAGTFKEDGWIYWSTFLNPTTQQIVACEFLDIIVPVNFPFTIDSSLIIDVAIKLEKTNGVTPTVNSIIISDRPIVSVFSNKIRIKGDVNVAWVSYGMYDASGVGFPKFCSGIQFAAGLPGYAKDSDTYLPIIFKKKTVSGLENGIAWSESTYPINRPGLPDRSFGTTPVPSVDILDTDKGTLSANLTAAVGGLLIQPLQVAPTNVAINHKVTIDWNGLAADSVLYNVRFVIYQLDQVTKLPIAEIATSPLVSGITGGTVQYFITAMSLAAGWYGYGVKVESTNIPQFANNEFDNGLTGWYLPGAWVPGNSGSDFYVDIVLGASGITPWLAQIFAGVPYLGLSYSVDVESFGVIGLPTFAAYTRQPNLIHGSDFTDVLAGDRFLTPMLLNTFTLLILGTTVITIPLRGGTGEGVGFFAVGQIWSLDQVTKQPLSLLYETETPVQLTGFSQTFSFIASPQITTAGWYGVGVRILSAPPSNQFPNFDFSSGLAYWTPDAVSGGGVSGWLDSGTGETVVLVPPGEIDTFGLSPLNNVNSYGVEIAFYGDAGTLYFMDAALNVLGSLPVSPGWGASTLIFSRTLTAEKFVVKYVATNYSGSVQRCHIDYISNLQVNVGIGRGTPASSDNKYWSYRSGVWVKNATYGIPNIFFAEDSYFLPPAALVLYPNWTGSSQVLAPNTRGTFTITPTAQPGGDIFGVFVSNNAANSVAHVRIRFVKNIKIISAPMSSKGYLIGAVPAQNAYKFTAGAWGLLTRVTGFRATMDDYVFSASLIVNLKGDCYHLAQKYIEKGVAGHSTDWALAGNYMQGFPYPSLGSDPDLKGLAYQEKVGQSIGLVHAITGISKEKSQSNVVRWSDNIILNSRLNGLNSFREANKFTIGFERGPIIKLITMNNRTLVCIHEKGQTSLYLNKKIVTQLTGDSFLSLTDQTVGDDLELSTDLGTINPESVVVVESGTLAYGFDMRRASVWQKSNNGVRNLTQEGRCTQWFQARATERLAALNSGVDVKVIGGYNVKIKTYFLTFTPFSYLGTDYPGYTIGWSALLDNGQGGFLSPYDFIGDTYTEQTNFFFSVKGDSLWLHDYSGFMNNFYGVQYNCMIKVLLREHDDIKKLFANIAIDSTKSWKVTKIRTSEGNVSALDYQNFKTRNGRFYADFLRDQNTPTDMLKAGETPLLDGFPLTGNWIELTLVNETATERVLLDAIYLGFDPLSGHLLHK